MKIVLQGRPTTKKNSQRIIKTKQGKRAIIQSKKYLEYESSCLWQLKKYKKEKINYPINLQAVYYMNTRHRVDLVNLLNATNDILVKGEILKDDNTNIVAGHDGSRVKYDKENPRVEIEIKEI